MNDAIFYFTIGCFTPVMIIGFGYIFFFIYTFIKLSAAQIKQEKYQKERRKYRDNNQVKLYKNDNTTAS